MKIALWIIFGVFAWQVQVGAAELCVEKKAKSKSELEKPFKEILDPKNKDAVPPGSPNEDYKIRTLKAVATVRGVTLVFVTFKSSKSDYGFIAPFVYRDDNATLLPVEMPDLGGGDSRLWRARPKIKKPCGRPIVEITFDGCSGCDAGKDLKGHFDYQALEKTWTYFSDIM